MKEPSTTKLDAREIIELLTQRCDDRRPAVKRLYKTDVSSLIDALRAASNSKVKQILCECWGSARNEPLCQYLSRRCVMLRQMFEHRRRMLWGRSETPPQGRPSKHYFVPSLIQVFEQCAPPPLVQCGTPMPFLFLSQA